MSGAQVMGNPRQPVNRDAANVLRRVLPATMRTEWSSQDEAAIRWAGLISKCPRCGDRAYERGFCFGCGRPLAARNGMRRDSND
jgi:hypothetical protein